MKDRVISMALIIFVLILNLAIDGFVYSAVARHDKGIQLFAVPVVAIIASFVFLSININNTENGK
jgi:hypothetical protein